MEMQLTTPKKSFFHSRRYKAIEKWSCPLPYLKDQVLQHTRFPKERIKIIPSGIDVQAFQTENQTKGLRDELRIAPEAFLFGLIGRIDPQKGQLVLLEAFEKLADSFPHAQLLFMGDPTAGESEDYLNELQQKVNNQNWSMRVHFCSFQPNVQKFYSAVDAVVMASYAETFGMVTLEALAAKKTVIGSNAAGTTDLLGGGKYGLLFESKNPQDLSVKMKKVLVGDYSIEQADMSPYDFNNVAKSVESMIT